MTATPYRGYTELPTAVTPDVPYRTNLALREIDADVHDLAGTAGAAQATAVSAEASAASSYLAALDAKQAAAAAEALVADLQADLAALDSAGLVALVAQAVAARDAANAAAAAALAPAADAITAALTTAGTTANNHLKAFYGTTVYMVTKAKFPALDDTGATNTTAALQAAIDAAPAGSIITLVGKFRYTNLVVDPTKDHKVDFRGASMIAAGAGSSIQCIGSHEAQVPVSAIAADNVLVENTTIALTKLTLATAPAWKRGDIVKVLADNPIPGGHVTSDTDLARVGEYMLVYSVAGTTVHLQGVLTESYSTNIRAARLVPGSIAIIGGVWDVSDERWAAKTAGNMLRLEALTAPKVIGATFRRLAGMGASFKSCYGYRVDDLYTMAGIDNTDLGVLSYSVHDSGCTDGVITGGVLRGGRHAFTDGTGLVPVASEDTASYGASLNFKLVNVTGRDMSHAIFDTHHMGRGGLFANCTAYPVAGGDAFFMRGRDHVIANPIVYGGRNVVSLANQVTTVGATVWSTGETRNIVLLNPTSFGTERVFTATTHTAATHPSYGVKDKGNLTIHGGTHVGLVRVGVMVNVGVKIAGAPSWAWGALANGAWFEQTNSDLDLEQATIDGSAVTTMGGGTQRLWYVNDAAATDHSTVRIGRLLIKASAAYIAAVANPFVVANTNTTKFHVTGKVTFETPWPTTNPFNIPDAVPQSLSWGCVYDPAVGNTKNSSAGLILTGAAVEGSIARLTRATDPVMVLTVNGDATARTMTTFPEAKYDGQRLVIILGTAGSGVTIPHGATYLTRLNGSVNKVLTVAGTFCSLTWIAGAWRES